VNASLRAQYMEAIIRRIRERALEQPPSEFRGWLLGITGSGLGGALDMELQELLSDDG